MIITALDYQSALVPGLLSACTKKILQISIAITMIALKSMAATARTYTAQGGATRSRINTASGTGSGLRERQAPRAALHTVLHQRLSPSLSMNKHAGTQWNARYDRNLNGKPFGVT